MTHPTANADWTQFVETALREGVLQWFGPSETIAQDLPSGVVSLARRERVVVAQRNLLLSSELVRLTDHFNQARIDFMSFKGVVAAVQFHGDLSSRPSGDLDLLVHVRDYDRAAQLLQSNGYQESAYHPDSLQGVFWNPINQTTIDLHWGIPPKSARLNHREVWRHRANVALIGASVPACDLPAAIALTAVNAVKNYWDVSLRQLVDLFVALRGMTEQEAQLVLKRCRRIGCGNFLTAASYVCSELFGILPQTLVRQVASNKTARAVGDEVVQHLFEHSSSATAPRVFASREDYEAALDTRTFGRLRDRVRMALMPNAIDKAWVPLPNHLHLLYFLVRPIRLLVCGRHRRASAIDEDRR